MSSLPQGNRQNRQYYPFGIFVANIVRQTLVPCCFHMDVDEVDVNDSKWNKSNCRRGQDRKKSTDRLKREDCQV